VWLNGHSYARGNWDFVARRLKEKGVIITKEGTTRGVVGYLAAQLT
jgi:hypothetical protein